MEDEKLVNPRIRSYFGFDPLELYDDLFEAVSFYIVGGFESIRSLMDQSKVSISQATKDKLIKRLAEKVNEELIRNADIFELYCERNVFYIPHNVDLAKAISTPKQVESVPNSPASKFGQMTDEDNPESLDKTLELLYQQINDAQDEKMKRLARTQKLENDMKMLTLIEGRSPQVDNVATESRQISESQINQLRDMVNTISIKAKQAEFDKDAVFSFEKNSFIFD